MSVQIKVSQKICQYWASFIHGCSDRRPGTSLPFFLQLIIIMWWSCHMSELFHPGLTLISIIVLMQPWKPYFKCNLKNLSLTSFDIPFSLAIHSISELDTNILRRDWLTEFVLVSLDETSDTGVGDLKLKKREVLKVSSLVKKSDFIQWGNKLHQKL